MIQENENGSYQLRLNDNNVDADFLDLIVDISCSDSSPMPDATEIATKQLNINDAILDLSSIPDSGQRLRLSINSDSESINRLALIKLQEEGDGSLAINGLNNSSGELFEEIISQNLFYPDDTLIAVAGKNKSQYDWFIQPEEAGFYAPVLITQEKKFITYGSKQVKNLGCNFFGFEDQGSHVGCDWDYNDLTARIEVAGVSTLSDIF